MSNGNFMTPSRNFLMDPFQMFSDLTRILEEPMTMTRFYAELQCSHVH
jgi:hypothetical protein